MSVLDLPAAVLFGGLREPVGFFCYGGIDSA